MMKMLNLTKRQTGALAQTKKARVLSIFESSSLPLHKCKQRCKHRKENRKGKNENNHHDLRPGTMLFFTLKIVQTWCGSWAVTYN